MPGEPLPPEIRQFLARHIASVEELEILLLLHRETAASWTAESVYQVIKSSRPSVQHGLDKFTAAGLLAAAPPDYVCQSSAATPVIAALARSYREMPVRVVEAIYQRPRDSAAQDFADAFKLKREP
jgi:hypothetical protein